MPDRMLSDPQIPPLVHNADAMAGNQALAKSSVGLFESAIDGLAKEVSALNEVRLRLEDLYCHLFGSSLTYEPSEPTPENPEPVNQFERATYLALQVRAHRQACEQLLSGLSQL